MKRRKAVFSLQAPAARLPPSHWAISRVELINKNAQPFGALGYHALLS